MSSLCSVAKGPGKTAPGHSNYSPSGNGSPMMVSIHAWASRSCSGSRFPRAWRTHKTTRYRRLPQYLHRKVREMRKLRAVTSREQVTRERRAQKEDWATLPEIDGQSESHERRAQQKTSASKHAQRPSLDAVMSSTDAKAARTANIRQDGEFRRDPPLPLEVFRGELRGRPTPTTGAMNDSATTRRLFRTGAFSRSPPAFRDGAVRENRHRHRQK